MKFSNSHFFKIIMVNNKRINVHLQASSLNLKITVILDALNRNVFLQMTSKSQPCLSWDWINHLLLNPNLNCFQVHSNFSFRGGVNYTRLVGQQTNYWFKWFLVKVFRATLQQLCRLNSQIMIPMLNRMVKGFKSLDSEIK